MAKPSSKAVARPRALPLHIGLNRVDPQHDGGWNGPRAARELDAKPVAAIAHAQIVAGMPARQTPHLFLLGQAAAFVAPGAVHGLAVQTMWAEGLQ